MSVENCQPTPFSLGRVQTDEEIVSAPRAITQSVSSDQIIKARREALQALGIPQRYPQPFISPLEIDQIDLKQTRPQVVGEEVAKVVWYISDQKYQVSYTPLRESFFLPKKNRAIMSLYYKCRNILMAQALGSADAGAQSKFMRVGDEVFFIKCILSNILTLAPHQPRPVLFSINFQKILRQNLSVQEIDLWQDKIKTLLEAAAKDGKASCFLDEEKKYALICSKNPNGCFSLSKAPITIVGKNLSTKEDLLLNLLAEANVTKHPVQAFFSGNEAYLAHGVKTSDGSFQLFEQKIDLRFQTACKPFSEVLQDIATRLRAVQYNNQSSALAELITEASKKGESSIWYSYNDTLMRIKAVKTSNNTFAIKFISPTLTEKELSFLGINKKKKFKFDQLIQELYHEAIQEPLCSESQKITKTFNLSDQATFQLSLKNGVVTIGTEFPCGQGGVKKIQRIGRVTLHNKVYAQSFAKDPKKTPAVAQEMASHQELSHPSLVQFMKASKKPPSYKMEYCDNGTGESFIALPPKNTAEVRERATLLYDAACGLAFIHSLPCHTAHMDFKPSNFFLTTEYDRLVGKVGDINPRLEGFAGAATIEYIDLEGVLFRLKNKLFASSQACDVWALGITLYESMYGKKANPLRPMLNNLRRIFENKTIHIDIPSFIDSFVEAHAAILSTLDDTRIDKKINDLIRNMVTLYRASRVHLDAAFLQQFHNAL